MSSETHPMSKYFSESIFDDFNAARMRVGDSSLELTGAMNIRVSRDDNLEVAIELTVLGHINASLHHHPAGTVLSNDDSIKFVSPTGLTCEATGVILSRWESSFGDDDTPKTVLTLSADTIGLRYQDAASVEHVVEWVDNLTDYFLWPENLDVEIQTHAVQSMDVADPPLRMTGRRTTKGGRRALHLLVESRSVYVIPSKGSAGRGECQLVYDSDSDQIFREKFRNCLSYITGKPLICFGHTEYCADWIPIFARATHPYSAGDAFYNLVGQNPYPLHSGPHSKLVDSAVMSQTFNSLWASYDALKFDELSWVYWSAICAPAHSAPASWGSLLEQLQKNAAGSLAQISTQLLSGGSWNDLRAKIRQIVQLVVEEGRSRDIFLNKLNNLNQAPQGVILDRLLEKIGLEIGISEKSAWKARNQASHGSFSRVSGKLIFDTILLKLLFHKMIAAITGCSETFVDTYSIDHPVRSIRIPIPTRSTK